jgi:Raf kinase inhibitor-like YbhB/YbcL family protein
MLKPVFYGLISILVALTGAGCASSTQQTPEGENLMTIQLTSTAFSEGSTIPQKFTCAAENISPALSWTGIPTNTQSLALIVDDPDAPSGTWVHWVLYNLPPDQGSLPEGVQGVGTPGTNDFRKLGYGGPCPPPGKPHRYYFKLYALDMVLNLQSGVTKADVEKAMNGHVLAQGQLMGKFSR